MERIGRYKIERELGRGSMSIVYEAFDPHINRHLAVKVLRERYARDLKSRQRFLREARSAGGLSHANIVTVFDVGQHEGLPFLVMERLRGQSLEEYLNDGGRLDTREILAIGIQLAGALDYAHNCGVIHRDVKPSNIYFDAESGLVKLVDFGIAAIGDSKQADGEKFEAIVGTPKYMAPEQIQGSDLDGRADLYALGVVLYRLLAGSVPFKADSIGALIHQIVHRAPARLQPEDDRTPVDLIELVHRLLAKDPEARPASGLLVLEELQEIRADLDRGLLNMVRGQPGIWRWLAALWLALVVVLGGGLAWIYQSQTRAMTESTYGYGDALASVVARETAEALLLDDTTALSNLVSDFSVNPRITYLHIADRDGKVQASTDPFLQGEPRPMPGRATIEREQGGVRLLTRENGNLEFQTPVRFQARRIGEVQLGVDGAQLESAAQTTLTMLALVFAVTLVVVGIGFSLLVRRQQRSIQRVSRGLQRIARGQYDARLDSERQDVFAPLFRVFNDMANRLEERHGYLQHKPARRPLPELGDHADADLGETVVMDRPKDESDNVLPLSERKS
ncbi:serine/threonine-protein kinase [Wenzhouxiangella sp. EGI_FJ10305]|uniref:serine/threonine-protein kinase n=1 Tax=Wenzhouxiangella sp. EGI_FJ10305 TaxID=3243768 RepID=UPI0035D9F636